MATIQLGIYRHYKGNLYEVYGIARHSESEDELVVYRALYGEHGLWVRPLNMFVETIAINGVMQPRFAFVKPLDKPTNLADKPADER